MAGSRWVRFDVGYFSNPKVMAVDREAMLLHLASIAWCGDQLTDGRIQTSALPMLVALGRVKGKPQRAVDQLLDVGLYVPNGSGGWHLHDFESFNRQATREVVEAERAGWAERQSRARSRRTSQRDHGVSPPDDTTRHDTTTRDR